MLFWRGTKTTATQVKTNLGEKFCSSADERHLWWESVLLWCHRGTEPTWRLTHLWITMDHFVKFEMLYSRALIEVENEEQTWGLYCIANQILTPSKYVRGANFKRDLENPGMPWFYFSTLRDWLRKLDGGAFSTNLIRNENNLATRASAKFLVSNWSSNWLVICSFVLSGHFYHSNWVIVAFSTITSPTELVFTYQLWYDQHLNPRSRLSTRQRSFYYRGAKRIAFRRIFRTLGISKTSNLYTLTSVHIFPILFSIHFLNVPARRICLTIKRFFSCLSFPLFSWT